MIDYIGRLDRSVLTPETRTTDLCGIYSVEVLVNVGELRVIAEGVFVTSYGY